MAMPSKTGPGAVLVAMTVANAMVLTDQTAVPLALPAIGQEFGIASGGVQWVLNASLLPLAGLLVLGGRLGDLLGLRRVFLAGSVLFAVASAAAGLAPSFPVLLAARIAQGAGGALLLPATVALVSAAYGSARRGRALGTMAGFAAVAGAFGPSLGGLLTVTLGWRSVLLLNLPLLVVTLVVAVPAVPPDGPRRAGTRVDAPGAALLGIALVGLVFGLAQSTTWGWGSPAVQAALVTCVLAAAAFVGWERHTADPLMDLGLLRAHPHYLGSTLSQALAGMVEMGLGLILPLLLVLNLGMDPATAGLALLASTAPMVLVAPLAGRWYDRVGGRIPLVAGFAALAVSGAMLAPAALFNEYLLLLPGLVVYGTGLAVVLTVNDPVGLDTVPGRDHGQASGVSATAEQGGGAIGIALLYAVFHHTYLARLHEEVALRGLAPLTDTTGAALRSDLEAAEQTGLDAHRFDEGTVAYLEAARTASDHGYRIVFVAVVVIGVLGMVTSALLVRGPVPEGHEVDTG
ncbi:multidrug resistance protein Stp [Pseudonocardia kongjuensis]|uniref:Multidrug resistance protein Stp n=2 Tax=Pseudonocardia kongjuensis TaxID=102227 RepID=A0ABP4IY81_9PSEU